MKSLISVLAFLAILATPASAQSPYQQIEAAEAAQDAAIAATESKAAAAIVEIDKLRAETSAMLTEIDGRLDALESGAPPIDPPPIDPPPVGADTSPRTLLNPTRMTYWAHDNAVINHVLLTGDNYGSWVSSGFFDEAVGKFVAKPTGNLILGLVRDGTTDAPAFFKGKYVLDWQGDGEVVLQGGNTGTLTRVNANRIEEDFDPAVHGTKPPQVAIKSVGAGVWNIRYYRASHEAALNAGKVFDPAWLANACRFSIVRPLDWSGVNDDREILASQRPKANRPVWGDNYVPDWALVRLATECRNELWITSPGLLGAPQAIADILRSAPGTTTQDQRVNAVAAAYDAIVGSDENLKWARAFVAELNRQSYPLAMPIWVEVDNEVWNWTFRDSTEFMWGIGRALNQRKGLRDNFRTGLGWQSARMAEAFQKALNEAGRAAQVWTLVIGTHTADPLRTRDALAAVKAYAGPIAMSQYGVATTGYYSGGYNWHRSNTLFGAPLTQSAWATRWLSDLAADRAALRNRITNYMLSQNAMPQNVAWVLVQAAAHKAEAERAGARWIGEYEGDSHDIMEAALAGNPDAVTLFREWHESADHGRATAMRAAGLKALDPKAIMANYMLCANGRGPNSPWVECSPWDQSGADNAAWDALLKPSAD